MGLPLLIFYGGGGDVVWRIFFWGGGGTWFSGEMEERGKSLQQQSIKGGLLKIE